MELLLIILSITITIIAQIYVNSNLNKYLKISSSKGITGFEVARLILDKNGLSDIYVTKTKGNFSDHYDPARKVVRLSSAVFDGTSISSLSVAAHECGHAVQDKENYFFIKLRGMIFPVVNLSSKFGYFAILIGIIFSITNFIWIGITLLVVILFFQLITLPVEFDASKKALVYLNEYSLLTDKELIGGKKVLGAAAMTYVASLATTLLEILRLVLIASNDR